MVASAQERCRSGCLGENLPALEIRYAKSASQIPSR